MLIEEYISQQPEERQELLTRIHEIILKEDKTVEPMVEPMMGKDMIVYKAGIFKYGLSGMKNYMSLHMMPIYGSPDLYEKYKALLPGAKFQKGCINFKNEEDLPLDILKQLVHDCSKIDLLKIKEGYQKSGKEKSNQHIL